MAIVGAVSGQIQIDVFHLYKSRISSKDVPSIRASFRDNLPYESLLFCSMLDSRMTKSNDPSEVYPPRIPPQLNAEEHHSHMTL